MYPNSHHVPATILPEKPGTHETFVSNKIIYFFLNRLYALFGASPPP